MLPLKALVTFTPPAMKKRSTQVKKRKLKAIIDKDDNGIFKQVTYKAVATTIPRTITFKIYQTKKKKFTVDSPTWVHCSCENYLFQWEVSNTARGSSSIINSNGAVPRIRNPRMRAGLCKHAFSCSKTVLSVSADLIPGLKPKKKQPSKKKATPKRRTLNKTKL